MQESKSNYQASLDKMADWLHDVAQHDVLTLMQVVEQAKEYLRAAESLTSDELTLLENYMFKDFSHFAQQWRDQAQSSLWLANAKHRFWQILGNLADLNKVEMFEMQLDVAHQGLYRAGELISIGQLTCTACQHVHDVEFVEEILPCLACGGTEFIRTQRPH